MSEFISAILKRMQDTTDVSIFEFNALEKFVAEKMPQYVIRKKDKKIISVPENLGAELGCPVNPFTEYEYPQEAYPLLWKAYIDGASGHFATETQWQSINRLCVGKPIMTRKMYGKYICYFSYEQTRQDAPQ